MKTSMGSLPLIFLLTISFVFAGCRIIGKREPFQSPSKDYNVAAYIWPSCHHDERFGHYLWPDGTGEWEMIKKGDPRFEGHYQPKEPLWGYELDNNPKVMEKWIDAAIDHNVNVFIFDWYWYDEGPFLESSLNDGFLKAKNNKIMNFYLMWANHDVRKNYWNVHNYGDDDSLLWNGGVDLKNFKIIVDRVINQYFKEENYFKIDSKPVFSIFSINKFIEGLGGLENARDALAYFNAEVIKAGFPGVHVQLTVGGSPTDDLLEKIQVLEISSVTQYNWGGPIREDYLQWGAEAEERMNQWTSALTIPYFPNASIGFDDTPRFPHYRKENIVHQNNTPENFATYLQKAKQFSDSRSEQTKLITIFSWNE